MTLNYHHKIAILGSVFLLTIVTGLTAQDSTAAATILTARYFLPENKVPSIQVETKKKIGRKFEPVAGIPVNIYFEEAVPARLLGKVTTDASGKGWVSIPPSFKSAWDSLSEIKFVANSDSMKNEPALEADVTIKKAILVIDTTNTDGVRSVTAALKEKKGNDWVAVKDVEMKLSVKRMLGNLSVGDADTYTSDSTGTASAEFKRDSIPGDQKGNLVLVASVEDNDTYGNLAIEKSVPWGTDIQINNHFWHRSLWSTASRAPVWLLFIVLSIVGGVWGTLIYLIGQIFKIKRIGKEMEKAIVS